MQWTTKVTENVFNVYPIYDWKTEDIWTFHGKFKDKRSNFLYDYMHKAGVKLSLQRVNFYPYCLDIPYPFSTSPLTRSIDAPKAANFS